MSITFMWLPATQGRSTGRVRCPRCPWLAQHTDDAPFDVVTFLGHRLLAHAEEVHGLDDSLRPGLQSLREVMMKALTV